MSVCNINFFRIADQRTVKCMLPVGHRCAHHWETIEGAKRNVDNELPCVCGDARCGGRHNPKASRQSETLPVIGFEDRIKQDVLDTLIGNPTVTLQSIIAKYADHLFGPSSVRLAILELKAAGQINTTDEGIISLRSENGEAQQVTNVSAREKEAIRLVEMLTCRGTCSFASNRIIVEGCYMVNDGKRCFYCEAEKFIKALPKELRSDWSKEI